jgi:hypothetical protein
MRAVGLGIFLLAIPVVATAQMDRGQRRPTEHSAVAPGGVDKNSLYAETEYISGHEGFTEKKKGQLAVAQQGIQFFDNKGRLIFDLPISTLRNAEHARDIRDPSVGKKLLFGALAGDRKQDFLTVTTETDLTAEGVVFKVKQNVGTGIAAKINFYIRKAQGRIIPPRVESPTMVAADSQTLASPSKAAPEMSPVALTPVSIAGERSALVNSQLRLNTELLRDTEFRLAAGDAQRMGLVTGFRETASDTLAIDLSDQAIGDGSTERHLGRLFAAYRGIASGRGSVLLLQHRDLWVGEYTSTGLARGDWR